MQWVVAIQDPKKRDQALNNAVGNWMVSDPAAATAWVNNSNLPAGQKKSLLEP